MNRAAVMLDCSAGFMMTVLPVTSAATVIPARMASGKFHGAMTRPTPRGMYSCVLFSPGTAKVACGLPNCRISAA